MTLIPTLEEIAGSGNVLTGEIDLEAYSRDATRNTCRPLAVVRPGSKDEVARIVGACAAARTGVIVRGAGSGLVGGAVPVKGSVVLDVSRMNKIVKIDRDNLTARVQAGVINSDLQKALKPYGLFYPPDPASNTFSTLGGNIAAGAGGLRAVKYGVTRDWVLKLDVVLADGRLASFGSEAYKCVVGYDFCRLFVGSEGTLGVIVEAVVKLAPLPEHVKTFMLHFNRETEAVAFVTGVVRERIIPRTMEFMDRDASRLTLDRLDDANFECALVLLELDGSREEVGALERRLMPLIERAGPARVEAAEDAVEREKLWKLRRNISPAVFRLTRDKVSEDITVPRSRLADAISAVRAAGARHGVRTLAYGHAGDGNLHVNFFLDKRDAAQVRAVHAAVREVFEAVCAMDGTLSGEHGIGITKAPYLGIELDANSIRLMKEVKRVFDPLGIMNPGKIFAAE